jgi:hypothetical protein
MQVRDEAAVRAFAIAIARDLARFHCEEVLGAASVPEARRALAHAIDDAHALYRSRVDAEVSTALLDAAIDEALAQARLSGSRVPPPPSDARLGPQGDLVEIRKAGARLLSLGSLLLGIGLLLLLYVDRKSGGGVSEAAIDRRGQSLPLLVGFPATLGYVIGALGLYRLVSGRAPGHERTARWARLGRVMGVAGASFVFWAGAFAIVWWLRSR